MDTIILFTDGSLHPRLKIGYGAYLAIREEELFFHALADSIKLKRFENTSSSKLELQTLLWALDTIPTSCKKVLVYTDAQTIIDLPGRRLRLEQNDYHSNAKKPLKNGELYRSFFQLYDRIDCDLIKIKGHLPGRQKTEIDRYFSLVDRASRKALREALF